MLKRLTLIPVIALLLVGCQTRQPADVATAIATPVPSASASACCAPMESGTTSELSLYNLESTWTDQNNRVVEFEDLKGKVVLITMIYSSCKGACPMIVADMRNIEAQVNKLHPGQVHYVLVSFDPAVDTPARLKEFASESKVGDDWTFLNGNDEDILELAALLGIKFKKTNATDYAHSNIITVLNPAGDIVHQQEGLNVNPDSTIKAIQSVLKSGE